MQKSKKGHNSAMTNPTEKKEKSPYFSCIFHTLNFKILHLTVLDRMQSVTDGRGQAQINIPP